MEGSEASIVSLVYPFLFVLSIERLRISDCRLLIKGEDELHDLSIATVGGCVE